VAPAVTAVVLAGAPPGERHPLWGENKCYLAVAGRPMLLRVVEALLASRCVGAVIVVDDAERALAAVPPLRTLLDEGRVRFASGADSAPASLLEALAALRPDFPVLVTTGDNALLTAAVVDYFCSEAAAGDLAVAFASRRVVAARYPETRRTYLRFRDDSYSSCNLFLLRTDKALEAVELWRDVTQHRKSPLRVIGAFGPMALAAYFFRRKSLEGAMELASRRLGLSARAVTLPFAEAAIDIDKPDDLMLAERILSHRV